MVTEIFNQKIHISECSCIHFGKTKPRDPEVSVTIHITSQCELNCPFCCKQKDKDIDISWCIDVLKEIQQKVVIKKITWGRELLIFKIYCKFIVR